MTKRIKMNTRYSLNAASDKLNEVIRALNALLQLNDVDAELISKLNELQIEIERQLNVNDNQLIEIDEQKQINVTQQADIDKSKIDDERIQELERLQSTDEWFEL